MKRSSKDLMKKYELYLVPLFVAGVVILTFTSVLVPTIEKIVTTQQVLTEQEATLAKLKKKRALLDSLDQKTMLADLQEAQLALPAEKNVGSIFISMENLATLTQLVVNTIDLRPGIVSSDSVSSESASAEVADAQIEQTVSRKGAIAIPVAIQTEGNTAQFTDFLHQLYNSRRIVDIEAIEIEYLTEVQDSLQANFSLLVYYLPAISQISSLDSTVIEFTSEEHQLFQQLGQFPDYSSTLLTSDGSGQPAVNVGKANPFSL